MTCWDLRTTTTSCCKRRPHGDKTRQNRAKIKTRRSRRRPAARGQPGDDGEITASERQDNDHRNEEHEHQRNDDHDGAAFESFSAGISGKEGRRDQDNEQRDTKNRGRSVQGGSRATNQDEGHEGQDQSASERCKGSVNFGAAANDEDKITRTNRGPARTAKGSDSKATATSK